MATLAAVEELSREPDPARRSRIGTDHLRTPEEGFTNLAVSEYGVGYASFGDQRPASCMTLNVVWAGPRDHDLVTTRID